MLLLGGGMNKRDGLCGENVCRDGNISKAGWPLPPGSLSLQGGCSRGGSLPKGRMVCRQGPRCPRGVWRRGCVPGPSTSQCPRTSMPAHWLPVTLSGCFRLQGAVA